MFYFIVNPSSRSGKGRALWRVVEKELKLYHINYEVNFTRYENHARLLAKQASEKPGNKTIVALGGDGTVNEIINGITDFEHTKLGYIPTGSSNDFARSMKIPTNTRKALHNIIFNKQCKEIDIGTVSWDQTTEKFGVSSGMGFDAAVSNEAYSSPIKDFLNKIYLGSLTYAAIAFKQLYFYKPCKVVVTVDDKPPMTFNKTFFVSVMNQKCEGGGLRLAPDADPSDEYLDVFIASDRSKLVLACVLPLTFFGLHTWVNGVTLLKCKKVHIEASEELPVHKDGEPCKSHRQVTMGIQDHKLRVCTSCI